MSAQPEVWRVSTVEGIFETDLETLKQWIAEGCVLPTDKVSKGSLNWIDAGRAPMLRAAFAGDFTPQPPKAAPAIESFGGWQPPPPAEEPDAQHSTYDSAQDQSAPVNEPSASTCGTCLNHPDVPAYYICRVCSATWCQTCPRFVSDTKIPLCASCGDLCKLYTDVTQKIAHSQYQASGFGFGDFATAIQYPLNHKTALLAGALIYGVLLIGGFWPSLVAGMIMFGCVSHAISQVAWGRLHRSFMPDFSEFHPWDDLVMPFFLGIGITIVTWGPVIALVLALLFGVLNGPGLSSIGGHQAAASPQSVGPTPEEFEALLDPNADPKKLEEANKKLQQLRPGAEIAREAERSKKENEPGAGLQMLLPLLGAGLFLLFLFMLGFAWAIFYYPMALTVAGYTQSFGAVINPLVGLDTIRRMGSTYFKAFGMVLIVEALSLVATVIIAVITSPFNMPFVGNLPANFMSGVAMFYFNLVIACLLGLSLFKSADRLGISVD